jgi:hypothetical protein
MAASSHTSANGNAAALEAFLEIKEKAWQGQASIICSS